MFCVYCGYTDIGPTKMGSVAACVRGGVAVLRKMHDEGLNTRSSRKALERRSCFLETEKP